MLDSSTSSSLPHNSRHSYLSHSSPNHDQTLDSIRNAIASDSQRIRVQDESTGQSYELQLGKEMAYPETFRRDHTDQDNADAPAAHDTLGVRDAVKSVASSGSSFTRTSRFGLHGRASNGNDAAASTSGSRTATPPAANERPNGVNGDANASSAASASAAHKVLRLPLIVRHRNTAAPPASSQKDAAPATETRSSPPSSRPFPKTALQSDADSADSPSAARPGDMQLQEYNRRYHESLQSSLAANGLKRRSSSNSRTSRDKNSSLPISNNGAPAAALSSSPASANTQYTAPPRHYPIMSELPPSPPLEADAEMERSKGILATASPPNTADVNPSSSSGPRQNGDLNKGPIHQPRPTRPARHFTREGSNSTIYLSADEASSTDTETVEADAEQLDANRATTPTKSAAQTTSHDDPTTPTKSTPSDIQPATSTSPSFVLRGSPDHLTTDSRHPLERKDSASSVRTSKALQAAPPLTSSPAITTDSAGLLHPASAQGDPSPSRRGRSVPSRGQPARRNTTGSSVGSDDSTGDTQRPTSSSGVFGNNVRRSSRDRWLPSGVTRRDSMSNLEGNSSIAWNSPSGVAPSSSSGAGGPLKTGDAGFDEEIAKHEALIRKRKERTRREEEEKVLAAQEAEKSEALEREQQKEKDDRRGGGVASGVPALVRAKSGLGKVGGGVVGGHATREQQQEDKALKGNIINETHDNYVLMYNMLTGIRIGVSRCQAKMKRPLQIEDYKAKHKFTFDIIGNELTPSAKYDFKFKDYAPWVFRELREYFHLDPADYLLSLTSKYILSELGSPGKSGSFFYFSRDYRFIIKTIRHSEHKFLLRILKDYHEHVKANPHTLLSRFYGLHRVKLPHGRKIHFVIMNNLFPPHRDIHETYDLKGSSLGREYPEDKAKVKKGATLKDINWIRRRRQLELGPQKRALFEAQLKSDVALLKRLNIMDYSLLIGLHDLKRGNSEGLREENLQVVQPETKNTGGEKSSGGGASGSHAANAGPTMTVGAVTTSGARPVSPSAQPDSDVYGSGLTSSPSKLSSRSQLPRIEIPAEQHQPKANSRPSAVVRAGSASSVIWSDEEFVDAETGMSPTSPGPVQPHHHHPHHSQQQAPLHHQPSKRVSEKDAFALRAAVRRSDAKALGSSSAAQLPARETSEKRHFLFYQDEAGFRSTDANDEPGDWIYYLGVIDLFTPYNSVKRGENWWKSIGADSRVISAVPPKQYGNRFVQFLTAIVRPMKWADLPPGFDKIEPLAGVEEIQGGPAGLQKKQKRKEAEA